MKSLLALIGLVVLALLAYNVVTTGELSLRLPGSGSAEEKLLRSLESQLDAAKREFNQAGKAAGLTGADTSLNAEGLRRRVEAVEQSLDRLQDKLSDKLKARADKLRRAIAAFKRELE